MHSIVGYLSYNKFQIRLFIALVGQTRFSLILLDVFIAFFKTVLIEGMLRQYGDASTRSTDAFIVFF
jgi:hypothetical protein